MAASAKCAHPSCECLVLPKTAYGKFCSEQCKKANQMIEFHCNCGHGECRHPEIVAGPANAAVTRPQL